MEPTLPGNLTPLAGSSAVELLDLHFPDPETPLRKHTDTVSWSQWMAEMELFLDYYLRHHDSPQQRLDSKLPQRFVLVD